MILFIVFLFLLISLPFVAMKKSNPANPSLAYDYIPPFPLSFLDAIHLVSSDRLSDDPLTPMDFTTPAHKASPKPQPATSHYRQERNLTPRFNLNAPYFQLGGLFPITSVTNGQVSSAAIQRLEAFRCAIDYVNQYPSVTGGIQFTYGIFDTQNSPNEALAAAIKMVQLNITSIIGNQLYSILCSNIELITRSSILVMVLHSRSFFIR